MYKSFFGFLIASMICMNLEGGVTPKAPFEIPTGFISFKNPREALDKINDFLPADPVIIDAGAFKGAESKLMAQKWPKGHVHAFEPVPELYQALVSKTEKISNITTYAHALGTVNGIAEMYISTMDSEQPSASSSLRAPKEHLVHAPKVHFNQVIQVQTLTLDTWAKVHHVPRIDLMWLDMQGVEQDVLEASPNILKTTKVIITEVSFVEAYEGQRQFKDLKEFLEKKGFVFIGGNFNPAKNAKTSWQGDALFVRRNLLK